MATQVNKKLQMYMIIYFKFSIEQKNSDIHMSFLAWVRGDCLLFVSFDVKKMAIGHIFLTNRLNLKRPVRNNFYFILSSRVSTQIGCCWLLCVRNWCRLQSWQFAHFCLLLIIFFWNQDTKTTIHQIIVRYKSFRMVPLDCWTVGLLLCKAHSCDWWRNCRFSIDPMKLLKANIYKSDNTPACKAWQALPIPALQALVWWLVVA